MSNKNKEIKIILSGLDNAGKSSMLVGIQRMYGFEEDVKILKPTIRVDYYRRDFLNMKLNFFDMGGQKKFRESYLKRPIYFESVNALIYLIDIQDELRFNESLKYLSNIINILDDLEYDKKYPINVCFSKSDYEFISKNTIEYLSRIKMIKDLIKNQFPDNLFNWYSTSIFNLYTIVSMISDSLHQYMDGYAETKQILNKYNENFKLKQVILFDHTGLVIAEDFKSEGEGLDLQNKIDQIISGHLDFFGQIEDQEIDVLSTRGIDGNHMNCCYQFHLYKEYDEELPEKQSKEITAGKKNEDPFYANYYISTISSLENSIDAENQIHNVIGELRNNLKKIIKF